MRNWFGCAALLFLIAACDRGSDGMGSGGSKEASVDPIVGVWDDPAADSGFECRADGSVIDLSNPERSNRWLRLANGRYEHQLDPGVPGKPPVVVQADLEGDLLRFDVQGVVCYRRRVWTSAQPGPRGIDVKGKFVVLMSEPRRGGGVTLSREFLQLSNGEGLLLRRRAGWVFINLEGQRLPTTEKKMSLELSHRYHVRGALYTMREYAAELERLGHGKVSLTRPEGCLGVVEVHELIQLEPDKARPPKKD